MLKFANCNLWLALGICILTGRVSAQIQVREVVSEGQAAPGAAAGETFLTLRETIINDAGNIAFGADLTGPNVVSDVNARGIWGGKPDALVMLGREGNPAPGMGDGVTYRFFSWPLLGSGNFVAFTGFVKGASINATNDNGVWAGNIGNVNLIARSGGSAPGLGSGVNFVRTGTVILPSGVTVNGTSFSTTTRSNDSNELLLPAFVDGPGIDPKASAGIWYYSPQNGVQLLAFSGDPAPGLSGVRFGTFNDSRVNSLTTFNSAGNVAMLSLLSGPGVTVDNEMAIWTGKPNNLQLRVRSGDDVPNMPGVHYGNFSSYPRLNNANTLLFADFLAGNSVDATNDLSMWRQKASGETTLVVREGSVLAGLPNGAVFGSIRGMGIDASDNVGIHGILTGSAVTTSNDEIMAYDQPGHGLHIAAREGDLAFMNGANVVRFGGFGSDVTMNEQGWLLFSAGLSGDGITVDNNDSIWAYRPDIGALMLAREGDNVDVGGGIIRRYRNFSLITASSGQDGLPSSFNASNQFVFRNEYWDFKDGIVVLAIPEPASCGLLLLPLLIRRKRRG